MVCSDVVRECFEAPYTPWGWCRNVEYVGHYNAEQIDLSQNYHIPMCGYPMLNRIELCGEVVWASSWFTQESFREYIELFFSLNNGARKPTAYLHNQIDKDI